MAPLPNWPPATRGSKKPRLLPDVERHVRQMIADEKGVVRRDRSVVEDVERGLELRRPAGQADHRTLLRILHQRPFAVVERQCQVIERKGFRRSNAGRKRREAGAFHQLSSVEHQASSEASFVKTGLHRTEGPGYSPPVTAL
jgi:hypothetical protein